MGVKFDLLLMPSTSDEIHQSLVALYLGIVFEIKSVIFAVDINRLHDFIDIGIA